MKTEHTGAAGGEAPVRASIVVPLFNRVDMTLRCLHALAGLQSRYPHEVVLVDNGSTDETPELLDHVLDSSRQVRNTENLGFATACNQGAAAARGDVVVFLNNDVEVFPGWLDPLVEALDTTPSTAAAGSLLLFPTGEVQHAGVHLVERTGVPLVAEHAFYGQPRTTPAALVPRRCSALTGASLAVRRDDFEGAGGFDTGYWNGYEDVDLCLRLRPRDCVYVPASVAVHHESQSGPERWAAVTQNTERFLDRWVPEVVPDYLVSDAVVEHPARVSASGADDWRRRALPPAALAR